MKKIKCYSVRLESLASISEKCYRATAFDGSSCFIPKSQVFGMDYDVQKSKAYWISSWILEQNSIQYSTKKFSFFDKNNADYIPETGIEIERHIPEEKEVTEVKLIEELIKPIELIKSDLQNLIGKKIQWNAPAYSGNNPYRGVAIIKEITDSRKPIKSECIDGDNLDYAFIGFDNILNYSDQDREVTYLII